MVNKIVLTPEQFKVFKQGHMIESAEGEFYNFPYWLKKDGKTEQGEDLYSLYARSEIPGIEQGYKTGGLQDKYRICKTSGKPIDPAAWYFLLNCYKDPNAQKAAMQYANYVEGDNPLLAAELRQKIRELNPNIDEAIRTESHTPGETQNDQKG
jgi:hypothetical protein